MAPVGSSRIATLLMLCFLSWQPRVADAGVTVSQSGSVILEVGEQRLAATFTPRAISGPQLRLERRGPRLSGRIQGQRVDVSWVEGRIAGFFGAQRLHLEVKDEGLSFRVVGSFGAKPTRFEVSPSEIVGSVAGCTYRLAAAAASYSGWRDCGGPLVPTPVSLQFPRGLADLTDVETAAFITLMLSEQSLPPPRQEPVGQSMSPERSYGLALGTRRASERLE